MFVRSLFGLLHASPKGMLAHAVFAILSTESGRLLAVGAVLFLGSYGVRFVFSRAASAPPASPEQEVQAKGI